MEMMAQMVAIPMAAVMMRKSNWYPLALSSILTVLAGIVAMQLPETHPLRRGKELASLAPVMPDRVHKGKFDESEASSSTLLGRTRRALHPFRHSMDPIWENPVIPALLSVFLIVSFGSQSVQLILQYISKRYGWGYGTVSNIILAAVLYMPSQLISDNCNT
jgi:hypothetical protein